MCAFETRPCVRPARSVLNRPRIPPSRLVWHIHCASRPGRGGRMEPAPMEIVGEEKTPSPTPPQAAADAASAPIRSSSDPFPLGQCEKWQCVPLCSTAPRCSLASLCVSGCSVTRALAAIDRDDHAKRPDGHDDCGLCGGRIESRQPDGRWSDGRAHKSCITEQRRAASKPIRSVSAPAATAGAGRKGTRVFSVRTV